MIYRFIMNNTPLVFDWENWGFEAWAGGIAGLVFEL
jgi:hypothetical protein